MSSLRDAYVHNIGFREDDIEGEDSTAYNLEGALYNVNLGAGRLPRSTGLPLLIVVHFPLCLVLFKALSLFVTLVTQDLAFAVRRKCRGLTAGQRALDEQANFEYPRLPAVFKLWIELRFEGWLE